MMCMLKQCTVISENKPTLENTPTPLLYEVVAKGAFLSKVHPPIYPAVHAVMLSKKHRRSSTKADMHHCCYCVSKQAHDKGGIAESLHAQITRARLTV